MSEDIFCENLLRQFLYEKLSEEKSMPNKFQHKPLLIKYVTKHFYQKLSEEKSLQNNFQKNLRPKKRGNNLPKMIEREISTNKYLNAKFNPDMSEEKFVTKQSVTGNSLPSIP